MVAASVLALTLLAGAPAQAQAWAGRGRLQGTVKNEAGQPVEGATITLRKGTERVDVKADGPAQIKTDKKGKWSILGLAQGPWGILIEKEGYLLSEGQVQVNEFAVAQPLNSVLKVIPKEVIEQAQQRAEQETATGQAKVLLQRGNELLAAAQAGGTPDKAKLTEARTAYEQGMAKLEEAKLETDEQRAAVAQTRLSVLQTVAGIDYQLGDTEKAIARLKEVFAAKPEDAGVLQLLIDALMQAGKEDEAKAYMAKLPAGTKVDPNTVLNMGIKAFNEGKMDQAFEAFDRAVRENPERADAYYYRGLVYLNRSKNAEAKADFQKLLQIDPNNRYAAEAKEFLKELH
jgi:tetratricopeptide (TPR) repeat protein